jgi:dihydroorotate dehydrogenase electron transfer subunit
MINPKAKQLIAEVVSNKKVGTYSHIVLAVNEISGFVRPGNFVSIAVGGANSSLVLRRAFAIYRSSIRGDGQGLLEIIVAQSGAGSRWLTEREIGDQVELIAPLGTSFGIPTEPVNALLVGGGYGSAPLFALADLLKIRGCRNHMVIGAGTARKIFAPIEGKRSVHSLTITTDDGTAGTMGRVTDVIPEIIQANDIEIIYSCGPMAMLQAISKISQDLGIMHQCSVEESMACGIGVCMTCVIPVKQSKTTNGEQDDRILMTRTCIEGPVINAAHVVWTDSREIPEGVWGK